MTMKLSAAISAILLLRGAVSQYCPEELTQSEVFTTNEDNTLTLKYAVVLSSFSGSQDMLCAHLESDTDGYIGFGISPSGTMDDGEAIIGIPDYYENNPGTVLKYELSGTSPRVKLMPDEKQTLMYTSMTQSDDGKTIMTFAKYMNEPGENVILSTGKNTFLYALGPSTLDNLGYHGSNKDVFSLDFDTTRPPTLESTTLTPTCGESCIKVSDGIGKTLSPTPAYVDRGRPSTLPPAPVAAPENPPSPKAIEVPASDPPTKSPTSADVPTPDPPVPDPPSGAMITAKFSTTALSVGAVAVWFGM